MALPETRHEVCATGSEMGNAHFHYSNRIICDAGCFTYMGPGYAGRKNED